jgi:hypothetical protein
MYRLFIDFSSTAICISYCKNTSIFTIDAFALANAAMPPREQAAMTRTVIFIYNHDAAHHVAHNAGIAGALAQALPAVRTIIAFASPDIRHEIDKLLSADQAAAVEWIDLSLPKWLHQSLAPLNRFVPIRRLARLYWHRRTLQKAAAIVATERTCLTLKRYWRTKSPRFILVPHGAGDRNVTTHPAYQQFDLFLLSGQKVLDQFVDARLTTADQCRIIGYAKFDTLRNRAPQKLFDNDRPSFVYNPHFDPHLSSWYDHGQDILQWFYERADDFNLIFAPHVMLFFKKVHISPEHKVTRVRPEIDPRFLDAPNIHIDTASERLFDMSYMMAADAYIGDVSSQVYEFLYRPRPCFFIDSHGGSESGNEREYDFWNNGPVVGSATELGRILPDFAAIGDRYHAVQTERMRYTVDVGDPRPASVRGAEAICDYLVSAAS